MDLSVKILNHLTEDTATTIKTGLISGLTGMALSAIRTVTDYKNIVNNLKRIKSDCLGDEDCEEKVDIVLQKVKEKAISKGILGGISSGALSGGAGAGLSSLVSKISGK